MARSGIYIIKNIKTDQVYVGSAVNLASRERVHFSLLKMGTHHSKYLQHAYDKYGVKSFAFRVIEFVLDINTLVKREQYWIDYYRAFGNGYNMLPKAGSSLGRHVSKKTKLKLSVLNTGRKLSFKTRKKMSKSKSGKNNPFYGKHHSKKIRKLIGNLNTYERTDVYKRRLSKAIRLWWKNKRKVNRYE